MACGVLFREKTDLPKTIKAKVLHLILSQSAHGHFIHLKCFKVLVAFFGCFNKKSKIFLDVPCRCLFRLSLRSAHIAKGQSAHRAKTLPWSGFKGKGSERAPNAQATPSNHIFKAKTYKSTSCHIEISPLEVLSCSSANYKQRCSALHAIMLQLTS